ncbi:hypothetical protein M1N58_00095 [Dehalococcoidales bacterium]|nr:hypothetical protein [Dehalococcoidales bacterium]
MTGETKLHDIVERLRGEWEVETNWGVIRVALWPERIGYDTAKGTPDEIVVTSISFPLFGQWLNVQAPVLIELERGGGLEESMDDIQKFSKRSCAGEQENHINLPMLVVGTVRKAKSIDIPLKVRVEIKEVPGSSIN